MSKKTTNPNPVNLADTITADYPAAPDTQTARIGALARSKRLIVDVAHIPVRIDLAGGGQLEVTAVAILASPTASHVETRHGEPVTIPMEAYTRDIHVRAYGLPEAYVAVARQKAIESMRSLPQDVLDALLSRAYAVASAGVRARKADAAVASAF